jgi:two-component system, sporulation sensor kinase A
LRNKRIFYFQIAFFLFAFCMGILILLKFTADLRSSSDELSDKIKVRSADIMNGLKRTGYARPAVDNLSFFDSTDSAGRFYISSLGCYFGTKTIWAIPENKKLSFSPDPLKDFDNVVILSTSQRIFLCQLEDGRTIAILFETPKYKSEWRETIAISTFTGLLALFGMFLVSYTIRKFGGPYLEDGGFAPPRQEMQAFDAVVIMKKTISELREKNRELEQKLGKEKMRAKGSASVLESLSSGLNAGFLRFDKEGSLQGLNPIANRLLGLPTLLRIGEKYDRLFAGNPRLNELTREAISQKTILTAEEVAGFQNKLLLILAIPLPDELGHFEGVLLIIHDRSHLYAMERAVREKEALARLGEVAAGVAHEIRNGLNVLSGELRLLRQESENKLDDRIKRIGNEIGQMEKVVRDLLYYSKPLALEKDTISLKGFSEELLISLKELFPDNNFSVDAHDAEFTADQDAVFRALLNVISNGAEAAGKGGEIYIKAYAEENDVVFLVEDSGAGITEEAGKDLFSLFASHKKGGTGLGLPISRKIAREHGGELSFVKSVKLKGAGFEFRIPK